jgi:hypothetical protein
MSKRSKQISIAVVIGEDQEALPRDSGADGTKKTGNFNEKRQKGEERSKTQKAYQQIFLCSRESDAHFGEMEEPGKQTQQGGDTQKIQNDAGEEGSSGMQVVTPGSAVAVDACSIGRGVDSVDHILTLPSTINILSDGLGALQVRVNATTNENSHNKYQRRGDQNCKSGWDRYLKSKRAMLIAINKELNSKGPRDSFITAHTTNGIESKRKEAAMTCA